MTTAGKLGGFLGLELPCGRFEGASVWDHLTGGATQIVTRSTARGALSALAAAARARRIWYPAYYCPEAVLRFPETRTEFYRVGRDLAPDAASLDADLSAGDIVVGVDFFGMPVGDAFRGLAKRRRDVLWIEDRAQALAPGAPWGDWLLHSPRKLFGVPDGGLAVCVNPGRRLDVTEARGAADPERLRARLAPLYLRYEDRTGDRNDIWYRAFREAEDLPLRADEPISRLTVDLLCAIPVRPVIDRRRRNAAALARLLPERIRLFPGVPETPLLAFPVVTENREFVSNALQKRGIFCPVHWRGQVSPRAAFAEEHGLAGDILSLPCDQRYGPEDMRRLAENVIDVLDTAA